MNNDSLLETLFKLTHAAKRQIHELIESRGMQVAPMNIRVLKIIQTRSNTTAADIVQILQRDKAQVTRLLNDLLTEEVISKQPNPADKRSHLLALTPQGQTIMAQVAEIDRHMQTVMKQSINKEEEREFLRIAARMTDNLEQR